MGYREDEEALRRRNETLERELEARERQLEQLQESAARAGSDRAPERPPSVRTGLLTRLKTLPVAVWLPLFMAAAGGLVYWQTFAPPSATTPADSIVSVCPVAPGTPLVILDRSIVEQTSRDISSRFRHDFVSVRDATTGERIARWWLAEHGLELACVGVAGPVVWLHTGAEGLHARRLTDGEIMVPQSALKAALPAGPTREVSVEGGLLRVGAEDGRTYYVRARPRVALVPGPEPAGNPPPSAAARLAAESSGRFRLMLNGHALLESLADPAFVEPTGARGHLWPDHGGLAIEEEVPSGSGIFRVVHWSEDGSERWEYTPDARASAAARWLAGQDSLYYFTDAAEVVGLSGDDGTVRFRVRL